MEAGACQRQLGDPRGCQRLPARVRGRAPRLVRFRVRVRVRARIRVRARVRVRFKVRVRVRVSAAAPWRRRAP